MSFGGGFGGFGSNNNNNNNNTQSTGFGGFGSTNNNTTGKLIFSFESSRTFPRDSFDAHRDIATALSKNRV